MRRPFAWHRQRVYLFIRARGRVAQAAVKVCEAHRQRKGCTRCLKMPTGSGHGLSDCTARMGVYRRASESVALQRSSSWLRLYASCGRSLKQASHQVRDNRTSNRRLEL